jgi:predicted  nucleic acid-binding Zn-ribbon protein
MKADESQTPKPTDESSVPEDAPQPTNETPDDLPVELLAQLETQDSTEDIPENSPLQPLPALELLRSDELPAENSVEPSPEPEEAKITNPVGEDSALEFLAQLEVEAAVMESEIASEAEADYTQVQFAYQQRIVDLQQQEEELKAEIARLQTVYQDISQQVSDTQMAMGKVVQEALEHLEQRKQTLQIAVEQLERRQERIRNEMRTTFAGVSQDLAIRVQGFKDYLVGSLQDLAAAAEQLELVPQPEAEPEKPVAKKAKPPVADEPEMPQFAEQQFQATTNKIRRLLDQYRNKPDYYGPPWQLRRTFEPIHAERVSNWFFTQGGRGALRTMGSRLQNILIASASISILHKLYGDRVRTLVLANSPERLGEWRRGLQDCLGISRPDFGPDRGVVLFETSEALAIKAERLVKANQLPLIVIDDSEEQISLALLQFPMWLAFAPDPKTMRSSYDDDF